MENVKDPLLLVTVNAFFKETGELADVSIIDEEWKDFNLGKACVLGDTDCESCQ